MLPTPAWHKPSRGLPTLLSTLSLFPSEPEPLHLKTPFLSAPPAGVSEAEREGVVRTVEDWATCVETPGRDP